MIRYWRTAAVAAVVAGLAATAGSGAHAFTSAGLSGVRTLALTDPYDGGMRPKADLLLTAATSAPIVEPTAATAAAYPVAFVGRLGGRSIVGPIRDDNRNGRRRWRGRPPPRSPGPFGHS